MSKYGINVRFETDDPKQAEAVKFLQSLEHSRNAFTSLRQERWKAESVRCCVFPTEPPRGRSYCLPEF